MAYTRGQDADYEVSQKNIFARTFLGYGTISNKYSVTRNVLFLSAIILLVLVIVSIFTKIVPLLPTALVAVSCIVLAGLCHLKFKPMLAKVIDHRREELDDRFNNKTDEETSRMASMLQIGSMRDIHDRVSKGGEPPAKNDKKLDKRLGLYGKSDPQTGKMVGLYGQFDDMASYMYGAF